MNRTISLNDLKALLVYQDVIVIDVRRKNDYGADSQKLPGAVWRNPEEIAQWGETLPKGKELVVYCVRGGSVSNAVVDHLQGKHFKARFIEGAASKHGKARVARPSGNSPGGQHEMGHA